MSSIKKILGGIKKCGIGFVKFNFFTKGIIRKNGAFLYPYPNSIISIKGDGKLILNGDLFFNADKYKGSKAEAYLQINDNSVMTVEAISRVNYGSTINVSTGARLDIHSMTTNVGINIQCKKHISIGEDCMLGRNVAIFDSSYHPTGFSIESMHVNTDDVIIGNHVWLGAYAFVMQGTHIGDGSIIGSHAYVRGEYDKASMVMAEVDKPTQSGMMWARSIRDVKENTISKFYSEDTEKSNIIEEADLKYSERIIECLSKEFDYIDFSAEKQLSSSGKLDSLGIMHVVTALNDEFDIKIPYMEIRPSNFESVQTLASLIWRVKDIKQPARQESKAIEANIKSIPDDDYFEVPDRNAVKKSIVEQIYNNSVKYPDKVAIVSEGKEYSYEQLFDLIRGYAGYYKSLGLKKGDMLLARSNQSINYVVTYFAAHLAGIEITTVEKNTSKEALYNMLKNVGAKVVSTKESDYDSESDYIFIDSFDVLNHVNNKLENFSFPDENDKADILFTTGTTGVSKGIELTHKGVVAGAENMASGAHMARHTLLICPNPLSHSNAIKQLSAVMISGGTFYILDGITDLNAFFKALDYPVPKVSIVLPPSGIRTIFQLAKEEFAGYKDRIEYLMAATAPLPEPDRDTLRKIFPDSHLYNHYGCSESSTISIYDFNKYKELRNCVGKATPNTDVLFVDENRNVINSSKDNMGLLAVGGATVMVGYYNDPKRTAEVMENGIVYTQDVGYIDDNGFIFITGRNDDVINVGGLKVAPTEVESAVMGLDSIADCICIGVNDEISGQALKLLIVPANGIKVDSKAITEYLMDKLEGYKIPHIFEETDHIERTYNGKLNRKFYRK